MGAPAPFTRWRALTPLKEGLNRKTIKRISSSMARASDEFPCARFERNAVQGLDALELRARVNHVMHTLAACLPSNVPQALAVLVRAAQHWDKGAKDDPLRGFAAWPVIDYVGAYGLEHFDASMEALRRLTHLFTAEYAVRPLLERDLKRALVHIARWTQDPDEHVRRLASEGIRPRLPWGRRVGALLKDPRPVLQILESLKRDPAEYVRRSVANNLNDIAKDHPQAVVDTCARWLAEAQTGEQQKQTLWVVQRATRTLVKDGHAGALALLGVSSTPRVRLVSFTVAPKRIVLGQLVTFKVALASTAASGQDWIIDYAIHHQKASGALTRKVFKLKRVRVAAREQIHLEKRHAFKQITTRSYHSGSHHVEILVNGKALGSQEFVLRV